EAVGAYREALRLQPDDFPSHHNLGTAYAYGGRWDKAVAELGRAVELAPADNWVLYRWGTLCFYTNDLEGYHRACRAMLEHFGETKDMQVADRTAKLCSLAPGLAGEETRVTKLVDRMLEAAPARPWYEVTKGLVEYRAGRF